MTKTDAEAGMGWTPGPWTVVPYGDGYSLTIHSDADNRVCFMATPGSRGSWDRIQADARLIAAAPELASLAAGVDDLLPLVSEWFAASPEERAKEGPDWEARAHMAVLALVSTARAALDSCKRREP